MEEPQVHLGQIYNEAMEKLRQGYQPERGQRLFQILVLPSFEAGGHATSTELFDKPVLYPTGLYRDYFATQVVWHMDEDLTAFGYSASKLKPAAKATIKTYRVELKNAFVENIFAKFTSKKIPAWIPMPMSGGVDGTDYEFLFNWGGCSAHFKWWENEIVQWHPFFRVVREFQNHVEALIESKK